MNSETDSMRILRMVKIQTSMKSTPLGPSSSLDPQRSRWTARHSQKCTSGTECKIGEVFFRHWNQESEEHIFSCGPIPRTKRKTYSTSSSVRSVCLCSLWKTKHFFFQRLSRRIRKQRDKNFRIFMRTWRLYETKFPD